MKTLFIFLLGISLFFEDTFAQQTILANYPLIENGIDFTGNNDPLTLHNVIFQNGGAYSNGIYYGNDTSGSVIETPLLNNLDFDNFSVKLDFLIEDYPDWREPILVGGNGWRWIGAYLENDKIALMANDGTVFETSTKTVPLNQWATIRLSYNKEEGKCYLYFNQQLAVQATVTELNHNNDANFLNTHYGSGDAFKGYWRNLIIYNTSNPTGITEENDWQNIYLYQKKDNLVLSLPDQYENAIFSLYDLQGKIVRNQHLKFGENNVPVHGLEGIYVVEVYFNNKIWMRRKIILKY